MTKSQVISLINNAYGFVDKNGVLFVTDETLQSTNLFELQSADQDLLVFSYEGAKFADGTVTFETSDGDSESFRVLVLAKNLV